MKKNIIDKETAEEICKQVYSVADFCRKVGWKPVGGNYRIFYKYVKEYNLDTSHFTGQKTNIGNKHNIGLTKDEFFKKDKLIKSSDTLKKIIGLGLKEYKCECCGITEWNGKEIRLQVHHIDGDHFNNELENLQILCPNCHSQTDTFAGKSNKKGEKTTNHERTRKYTCNECGKPLHRKPKTGLCRECLNKLRKSASSLKGENDNITYRDVESTLTNGNLICGDTDFGDDSLNHRNV